MKSNKKEKLQANLGTLQLKILELKSKFDPDVLTYNQYINIEKEIRVLENEVNQLQFVLNYGFVNYFKIEIGKKYKYFNSEDGFNGVITINSIEQTYDSSIDSNYFTPYEIEFVDDEDGLKCRNVIYEGSYGWLYEVDGKVISLEESD